MKLIEAIDSLGKQKAKQIAKKFALAASINWDGEAKHVFKVIVDDPSRVPGNIGSRNDNAEAAIEKWVKRYRGGLDGRASKRLSKLPGTVADPIIEKMIGARLDHLSKDELRKITFAHRVSMSAENILGLILEEYLSENLKRKQWFCAWGETVRSVDFVHASGKLLQVKNRSNSENSSSSAVRDGTEITKWYRIEAAREEYKWAKLNSICGTKALSEDAFAEFVKKTIVSNPDCLAVEHDNPWQ